VVVLISLVEVVLVDPILHHPVHVLHDVLIMQLQLVLWYRQDYPPIRCGAVRRDSSVRQLYLQVLDEVEKANQHPIQDISLVHLSLANQQENVGLLLISKHQHVDDGLLNGLSLRTHYVWGGVCCSDEDQALNQATTPETYKASLMAMEI
jgi:hypothetical protein